MGANHNMQNQIMKTAKPKTIRSTSLAKNRCAPEGRMSVRMVIETEWPKCSAAEAPRKVIQTIA